MAYAPLSAKDSRRQLALAKKLRDIAAGLMTADADSKLFLAAAAALEARASWMATALPADGHANCSYVHQPVNLLV